MHFLAGLYLSSSSFMETDSFTCINYNLRSKLHNVPINGGRFILVRKPLERHPLENAPNTCQGFFHILQMIQIPFDLRGAKPQPTGDGFK